MIEKFLTRLTDAYNKDPNGNVAKLLQVTAQELEEIEESLGTVKAWRNVDEAEGQALDAIGYNVQQWRGQATDPVYRILIKSKVARNLSDGTLDALVKILAVTLDVDPEEVRITPTWAEEMASVHIDITAEPLNEAGFSLEQFGRLCNRIVSAGVRAYVMLEGTFEFSSQEDTLESDPEAGFNELVEGDPGDVGGFFGSSYDPASDPELPI